MAAAVTVEICCSPEILLIIRQLTYYYYYIAIWREQDIEHVAKTMKMFPLIFVLGRRMLKTLSHRALKQATAAVIYSIYTELYMPNVKCVLIHNERGNL